MSEPTNPYGLPPELLHQIVDLMDACDDVIALSDEELAWPAEVKRIPDTPERRAAVARYWSMRSQQAQAKDKP